MLSVQVSQDLKQDEADRFQIVLFASTAQEDSNLIFISLRATIVYGPGERIERTDELLCAFRGVQQFWDEETQLLAVMLAREMRQRQGRMSRRLLELLGKIETTGWADNLTSQREAGAYDRLCRDAIATGQFDVARAWFERALAVGTALATEDKDNADRHH